MALRTHLQESLNHPFHPDAKNPQTPLYALTLLIDIPGKQGDLLALHGEADINHDVAMLTPVGLFTSLPPTIESRSLRKSKGRREWISMESTCMYSPVLTYSVGSFSVALFAQYLRGVIPSAQKMPLA